MEVLQGDADDFVLYEGGLDMFFHALLIVSHDLLEILFGVVGALKRQDHMDKFLLILIVDEVQEVVVGGSGWDECELNVISKHFEYLNIDDMDGDNIIFPLKTRDGKWEGAENMIER